MIILNIYCRYDMFLNKQTIKFFKIFNFAVFKKFKKLRIINNARKF